MENKKEEKLVKVFHNCIIKTDILVDKPLPSYIPYLDIEREFDSGNYFCSFMTLACTIESNLRAIALLKSELIRKSIKVYEKENLDKISLNMLIEWVAGKEIPYKQYLGLPYSDYPQKYTRPLITQKQMESLILLKDIRNDMAHCYYLTNNKNLRKEFIRKMINTMNPIHTKFAKEINRLNKFNERLRLRTSNQQTKSK